MLINKVEFVKEDQDSIIHDPTRHNRVDQRFDMRSKSVV